MEKFCKDFRQHAMKIVNYEKKEEEAEFTRGRKLNISLVFITQSHFKVAKGVRLNSTHFFIMKIVNKR